MRSPDRYEMAIILIGFLYSINELVLQGFIIGPNWIRWYLSDFAFPLSIGGLIWFGWKEISMKTAVIVATVIGVASEGLQFVEGRGDPIEIQYRIIIVW